VDVPEVWGSGAIFYTKVLDVESSAPACATEGVAGEPCAMI
jgi:hypothetical protein